MIRVERLRLGEVVLPDWHPRALERTCAVFGYAVVHPDGIIVFDTGMRAGNAFIDDAYSPTVVAVDAALADVGLDERDVAAVVNSHLHFDHCGQNAAFYEHGVPVFVHDAECIAAETLEHYTVNEWARVPSQHLRRVVGDENIADGVTIIPTPGHTPGHQSLIVETATGRTVIAGQCVYKLAEVQQRQVALDNMHNEEMRSVGQASLERLLSFGPCTVVAAHDDTRCTL